jgi:transcription antitermination protein NusB
MSRKPGVETIPARVSVKALAEAIGVDISAVQLTLRSRGETSQPDDLVDPSVAVSVARALGSNVELETRDLALERLYELESRVGQDVGTSDLPPRAERLVEGVTTDKEDLDHEIEKASQHWAVARMPMVDRTILRLALWELRNDPDTPKAVVVSEAVRLAGTYSTAKSGAFVNGVVAALAKVKD